VEDIQFALGIILLIIGVAFAIYQSATGEPSTRALVFSILGPGIAGYMLPKYWVTKRQQKRQEEITNGFPDSLDMMLVCVEAGQSMDQSIIRVSKEIRAGYPALADEFEIVSYETKAGKDKVNVLRTPKDVFAEQLKSWDKLVKKLSDEDPFFAKVWASQKEWAKRVGYYHFFNNADYQQAYEHLYGKLGFSA